MKIRLQKRTKRLEENVWKVICQSRFNSHQRRPLDEPNKHQLVIKPEPSERVVIKTSRLPIKDEISNQKELFY